MANRKISELGALTAPAADDLLAVVDVSEGVNANKNKKITYGELLKSIPDGTAGAPSFSFDSAATTGFYRSAANELSIATNGAQAIKVEANNKTTIYGDLVVTGTQTTVSSTTVTVADKNLELATGNSTDAGLDGGGLTLKGATDKTWTWVDSTDAWTSNQHLDLVSGKAYKIQGVQLLSATTLGSSVVTSSLTSVGTLGALTVTNAVTAGSLDISGDADIDGTLEADAYTVNGTALNEYISDTVGAMVSSNTETNIAVTYDDSDNTLDFVIGTLNQDTTGNAATATALETARTIGGVSFNGTANINLPGVNQTGNQNTTGSAATLTTARTIGGVSFDGSANINLPGVNAAGNQNTSGTAAGLSGTPNITVADVVAASLDISGDADIDGTLEADAYTVAGTALNEYIADTVGAMVSSNTETNITVTYQDSDNTLDFVIGTLNQDTTGNAATATALQTARTIGGVSFDGTGNITLPGVNATGNQNTTGSAATLTTARTIGGVSFNGSANIDLPGVNAAGNQNTTGSAATLTTARTIGGVSFDGSANINLPGVNTAGNQNTTGSAATLTTARTIGGVSFNGSANIDLPGVNAAGNQNTSGTSAGLTGTPNITVADVVAASLDISGSADIDGTLEADAITVDGTALNEYIADTVGAMVSSNTETNITVTYEDSDNTLDFVIGTLNQDTTGSAATLTTARTIGGVSFNGSANIDLPGVNTAGNQNTSGTSAGLTGTPNITVGDVVAASLDISGNVDVDGTLETDALTINGVSLSETIADTVGAMVTSNTETGISVTYDDADNTLDFVVATLNQDTTGNAATATALATARTIGGTSFDGTANITPANATNAVNVTGTIASAVTGTTQSASDNSTKIATTAYVETAISTLIDSAPGALNTLNELAAAIGDDANFSTTITNSIATKVPLSTIDAKGDIYVGTANDTVTKLAAGSNGQVLKANSSEATGLEWATISTTDTTYSQSFVDSSNDIILRLAAGGSGSGNDDVKFVAGSNITLTHTDADNITIAASGGEITVQDEGSSLSTAATTLNFVGAGVVASGTGAAKTITISGGTANHTILTLRNAANNGSADLTNTDFTLVTSGTTTAKAVVSAQQLLVSVNGVVQQPNAGTSTSGLDGFVVDTGTTGRIKFCAAPGAGADIFVVQLGDTVDIGTPSDNTVDLAQLAHATQGDVVYYGASGTPARLGAGTSGYYLKTQGSGANPVWAAVSQYTTPLTTRGDILFRDASGDQRLAAGTSGYFLKTQGSGADPVWSAVPAGITINNQADNRVVTATGTTNTLNGEASLTFDGTKATAPVHTASNGIVETAATIASNHTISTNYNAMSVGPVAVSATLTIPSGSVWTIV